MRTILNVLAILLVTGKRLFAQKGLTLAIAVGLTVTVAMGVCLPVYSDAVNFHLLTTELTTVPGSEGKVARRSPFAFMFRYLAGTHDLLKWADIEAVDQYLCGPAGADLGLPRKLTVRYVATDNLKLFPERDSSYADSTEPLGWVTIGTITDLESRITLLEGRLPVAAPATPDSAVEVLVSEEMAIRYGLQVGESLIAFDANESVQSGRGTFFQLPVQIAGIWRAQDPQDEFWFYDPSALSDALLVPEATLRERIGGYADHEIHTAIWYLVMDGSQIRASDAGPLRSRINTVQQRAHGHLLGLNLASSPLEALTTYRIRTSWLAILLYAFSIPIIGLLLAFIGLAAGLSVERQRGEIAILRSRGATVKQVFNINLLQGALVGVVALAAGVLLGQWLAYLIGRTRSFLDFSSESVLRVVLTQSAWQLGLGLLGVAVVAQAAPVIGAAQHTIVTYKQERARMLRASWWQRAWLDVLLLIPAAYGLYVLRRQGSILSSGGGSSVAAQVGAAVSSVMPSDPFQNPLLFLVPALATLALTLLILRLLPPVMSAMAWLAGHTRSVAVLLSARHLARTHTDYAGPLVLLILTLSLSTYTASLAQTLDDHAYDQRYYAVGADMRLVESGESTGAGKQLLSGLPGQGTNDPETAEEEANVWEFAPVEDHLRAPGVHAVTRVARYRAASRLETTQISDWFMGVDRTDFARVAFWRRDFARSSLGALMNALAAAEDGVLVPRDAAARYGLDNGDRFRIVVYGPNGEAEMDVQVVGTFDLFPTWYPQDGVLLVGNNEYLFEALGGQAPYDVWLDTDAGADGEQIVADLRELGFRITSAEDATQQVARELRRPERQGLFGVLSVGFAAAAFLAALGFLLNMLFSFRRRYIELGILRAIGLSGQQMTWLLASELAFLILTALVAGTALGAGVSKAIIPYLQVGHTAASRIPPYVVTIGWASILRIYVLLAALFVVTLGLLAGLLLRMRINQAVKLGDTA